tara:strand:- start:204 stop:560 length:357 start_codon:yes stop_codon:yes gene_type:complete
LAIINNPQAVSLAKQLFAFYVNVKKTQNDKCVCDICGVDFTDAPYYRKPRPGLNGFANNPDVSPVLCMSHKTGWGLTLQNAAYAYPPVDETNAKQVELLFAQFLAKHIIKYANQLRKQ